MKCPICKGNGIQKSKIIFCFNDREEKLEGTSERKCCLCKGYTKINVLEYIAYKVGFLQNEKHINLGKLEKWEDINKSDNYE